MSEVVTIYILAKQLWLFIQSKFLEMHMNMTCKNMSSEECIDLQGLVKLYRFWRVKIKYSMLRRILSSKKLGCAMR